MRSINLVWMLLACFALAGCPGIFGSVPLEDIRIKHQVLTERSLPKRTPVEVFDLPDNIIFYTTLSWPKVEASAGYRQVRWKWYNNGELVASYENRIHLERSPWDVWGYISASSVGVGDNKVEMYIDDKLMSSATFKVDAGPKPSGIHSM